MPYFEAVGLHEDYQNSLSRLFQTYVNDLNRYEIVLPQWQQSGFPAETRDESREKASSLGARFFLKGIINSVGERIIVSVNLYRTDNGTKVWGDLVRAASLEELDPILMKMAKNLGVGKSSGDKDIYSSTDYESDEPKEITAKAFAGIMLGGSMPFGYPVAAGMGLPIVYDSRSVLFGTGFEYYLNQEVAQMNIYLSVEISIFKQTKHHVPGRRHGLWFAYRQDSSGRGFGHCCR